jgi:O-antigen/teichoic acid export membrane protein
MPTAISDKILRNTAWNLFSRLIHIPVSIGLIPFIIGQVGMSAYGIWVALFSFVDYFSLLEFGIGAATIKYVADYHTHGDSKRIGQVISTSIVFNFIFIPPLVAAHFFDSNILGFFQIPDHEYAEAEFIFKWVLLNFALSQFANVFRNTLIGLQRIHINNLFEISYFLAYALTTLFVLSNGWGLKGVIVVVFFLRCALLVAQAIGVWSATPGILEGFARFDRAIWNHLFRYGFKLQVLSLAGLLNSQLDKLLIGHFLKIEFVAFYEIGSKLAQVVRYIPTVLIGPLIPASAELWIKKDTTRIEGLCLTGTRYVALLAAPFSAFLVSMAPAIIQLWLQENAHPSAIIALQILGVAYFFNAVTGVVASIGRGTGVLRFEMQAGIVNAVLNVVLSVSMMIQFGFVGALLGTGTAMIAGNLLWLFRFTTFLGINRAKLLSQCVLKPLACAAMAGFASFHLLPVFAREAEVLTASRAGELLLLAGTACAFVVIYFSGLAMTRCLTTVDIRRVGQTVAAVRNR